ncbi:hypothetical protein FB451DRAFT_1172313 [Mycena latifolia]|nr:hypothetical protein FB451DRAFT_1172313 [Mycena latifolia]
MIRYSPHTADSPHGDADSGITRLRCGHEIPRGMTGHACNTLMQRHGAARQAVVLDKLPGLYGLRLPGWDELNKAKTKAPEAGILVKKLRSFSLLRRADSKLHIHIRSVPCPISGLLRERIQVSSERAPDRLGVELHQIVRSVRPERGWEPLNVNASSLLIICREAMKMTIVVYIYALQQMSTGRAGENAIGTLTDMFGWNHSKPKLRP